MITTGVDTCIFFDVISGLAEYNLAAVGALEKASRAGPLVVSVVCYAELAMKYRSPATLDLFLSRFKVRTTPLDEKTAFVAGQFYREYKQRGGTRARILPDFLIGAHALLHADRLLTRDHCFFSDSFATLKAVAPEDL